MKMNISVIVPLFNEEESLPELYAWIERVMKANNFTYEVIFVNDGSTDHSWDVIRQLSEKSENVRGIKFRRNYGKSPALYCGFYEAQGDVVITMGRTESRAIHFQRLSLQNYSMLQPVRLVAFITFMISTADSRHTERMW